MTRSVFRLGAPFAAAVVALLLHSPRPARAADVWQPLGPDGGNVAALAVDPQDGNTIYAGALQAGVFRSANGGRSWQPAGLDGGVTRLAVAPNRAVYAVAAQALYRSRDRGTTWVPLTPGLLALGKPKVQSLALSSTLGTLFVVAGTGDLDRAVLKSTDGGNSWTAVFRPPGQALLFQVWTDPTDPRFVFAATALQIYASADGGAQWGLTGLPVDPGTVSGPALAIEAGPRHRLLALHNTFVRRFTVASSIAASSDRGRTWRARDIPGRPVLALLCADPISPGAFFAVALGGGLFHTADAGLHWTSLGQAPFDGAGGEDPTPRALAFDPHRPGVAFLAVPGGRLGRTVWKTASFGAAWTPFNRGLFAGGFASVTVDLRNPATLWSVGQGSPLGLFQSADRGATWAAAGFNAQGIFGFAIAGRGHSLFALLPQLELDRSDDGGQSWAKQAVPAEIVDVFASPPEEPDTFYVLGTHTYVPELEVSLDGGATWANRPLAANVLTIAPRSPATLYANTRTDSVIGPPGADGVQRSTDRGATWTTILQVTGGSVSGIGVDPADPRRLVVAHYQLNAAGLAFTEVLWTADGGATWTPGTFPPEVRFAGGFLPDPLVPHGFLAGTDAGAYASADGGATWTRLGDGLPRIAARLSSDPGSPQTLYAATAGGGIYRLERTEP